MKNTNKNMTDFKVMLAKPISSEIAWPNTHFVQPKLDGVRCYTQLVDGEVKMFSRNHKEFKNVKHITTELTTFFNDNPNITLDGELYNHKFRDNFNKIISLVRKQKPTQADKFESSTYLQYHVYDMVDSKSPLSDFINRTLNIGAFKSKYGWRSIQEVDTKVVFSNEQVQSFHTKNKNNGYEGSILRTNGAYDQRRSNNLQKVKDWSDTEITITGFVEGKGKFKGGLGKFLGVDSDNRVVEVPWPTLTIEQRKNVFSSIDSYIGKKLTFEYFERTPSGAYRFPRAKAIRNYE